MPFFVDVQIRFSRMSCTITTWNDRNSSALFWKIFCFVLAGRDDHISVVDCPTDFVGLFAVVGFVGEIGILGDGEKSLVRSRVLEVTVLSVTFAVEVISNRGGLEIQSTRMWRGQRPQ